MSLSEAYGGQPSYTILTYAEYVKDMERMGQADKLVYDSKVNVDDDLCLSDLIATIKNLPVDQNDSSKNIVVSFSESVQP